MEDACRLWKVKLEVYDIYIEDDRTAGVVLGKGNGYFYERSEGMVTAGCLTDN